MKVVSRINRNVLNSRATATVKDLGELFAKAPNMASKTIKLFPQNSLGFFTEGMGEIYDVKDPNSNVERLNDNTYRWKVKGHEMPNIKFGVRSTGGAIAAGSTIAAGQEFTVAFASSVFNPRDKIKLENKQVLYVLSEPQFKGEGVFEYDVMLQTNDANETVATNLLVSGKEASPMGNAYPELSDKGYISFGRSTEWHVNYTNKFRYDWTVSAEALATQFLIQDIIPYKGKKVSQLYISDELLMEAMDIYHFHKEMDLIYGRSTMDANGKCFMQDPKTGQDIVQGDGIIQQMADSQKQNYTTLTLDFFEDILSDMALRMPNKTGNMIMCTTGLEGYKAIGRLLRSEHKGFWNHVADPYVQSKNGKIKLGAEYNAFTFQGNTIMFVVNNVFDHPSNASEKDNYGKRLESSKFLFLDVSSYDGVRNLQMIAKNGRSFITGNLKGLGGEDGMSSGDMYTTLDANVRAITGTYGIVMHNPYSSYMLEKTLI